MSRDGWAALPGGATGLSAVCDYGSSWSYSLTIFLCLSLFCYTLLCVHSSFAIILKRKGKLVVLLLLSYRCIVAINVLWLFITVPWVCLQCVIVVFPDHIHLVFCTSLSLYTWFVIFATVWMNYVFRYIYIWMTCICFSYLSLFGW